MNKDNSFRQSNKFLDESLESIPRLLGQLDRNRGTLTYGSFDRNHWLAKTADISNARNQEAIYTLSLIYARNFEGNVYYKNKKILEWIIASLKFTKSIQKHDGSFDEYYQNESSFVCTSFVTIALAQTYFLMKESGDLSEKQKKIFLNILEESSQWLSYNLDDEVSNQLAGSAFALSLTSKILNKDKYQIIAKNRLELLLTRQSNEGWWSEYGGPDIGYLSVTIDYLAKFRILNNDQSFDDAIKKALNFLINFIHPDYSVGGNYGSRNTEYLIPSGFSLLENFKDAKMIIAVIEKGIKNKHGFSPTILDDRYLCNILYNWIEAGLSYAKGDDIDLWSRRIDKSFEESSIRVFQNSQLYFVSNLRKGGSFSLFTRDGNYSDSGLLIQTNKKNYTTGNLTNDSQNINKLTANGTAAIIKTHTMSGLKALIFKTWQFMFGKIPFIQKITRKLLRKVLITESKKTAIKFNRSFKLKNNELFIKDTVEGVLSDGKITINRKGSYNAVVSSKYFSINDILLNELVPIESYKAEMKTKQITRLFKL